MNLGLEGKYALITGGSRGIGRSTALALADEGCNIAVCARNKEDLEKTVNDLKKKKVEVLSIKADVLNLSDVKKLTEKIIDSWKTIHILINNVGGGGRWGEDKIEDTPEQVWVDVYNKNVLAAIRFTIWAIPYMKKQKWGRIVNVASRLGREGGGRPWFNMAKSAQISMMKTLSMNPDLVRNGITFNSVAPGGIMIPNTGWEKMKKDKPKEFKNLIDNQFPLGRLGTPEEVANVIVFICSEKANFLNGACISIDGGESRAF